MYVLIDYEGCSALLLLRSLEEPPLLCAASLTSMVSCTLALLIAASTGGVGMELLSSLQLFDSEADFLADVVPGECWLVLVTNGQDDEASQAFEFLTTFQASGHTLGHVRFGVATMQSLPSVAAANRWVAAVGAGAAQLVFFPAQGTEESGVAAAGVPVPVALTIQQAMPGSALWGALQYLVGSSAAACDPAARKALKSDL